MSDRDRLYGRPALAAVAVEVVLVVVFGNQWMLDHVVLQWNRSTNILERSASDAISVLSWPLTPHGFPWLWIGQIVHALVWFAVTYLLVRRLLDVRDPVGRFVGVVGAVFLAELVAIIADRLVGYPNVHDLYGNINGIDTTPTFFEWLLDGAVGTGGVLFFVLIGALAAWAVGNAISLDGTAKITDESDVPGE